MFKLKSEKLDCTKSTNDFSDRMFTEDNSLAMQPCEINFSPEPAIYGPHTRHFQGIASIAVTGKRLWATWFSGDYGENIENYTLLAKSDDYGKSWSDPTLVIDPPGKVRTFDSSLWVSPEGELFLYYSQAYGWYDGRAGVWQISTKNPEAPEPTWSQPQRLCDGVMVNKPIVCANGYWAYPVCLWLPDVGLRAKRNPEVPLDMYKPHMYVSQDKGATIQYQGSVDIPQEMRNHDENVLVEPGDGNIYMLIRTKKGIVQSMSEDDGKTWSEISLIDVQTPVARFSVTRLKSGRLLMIKNGAMDKPMRSDERITMVAYLSDDQGQTWPHSLCLDTRPDVSYPNIDVNEQGRIYVIYDHSRYKEKEIMMAKITEDDICAGEIVSDGSELMMVVDKATGDVAKVTISPAGGTFNGPVEVELTYPIFGPCVYYTLDGSDPELDSTRYTQKILVEKTTEIKARSIGGINGQTRSPITSAKFVINE